MLEHLLDANPDDFLPSESASPIVEVDAKYATAQADEADDAVIEAAQLEAARNSFSQLVVGSSVKQQKEALASVDTPAAVKHLVGMLTAYDWAFVTQAKELRGYAVAQILEETKHPDARLRLKALELLGKVTEVALFTERHEVKQTGMSDAELDEELKHRLERYMALERDITPDELPKPS